MVITPAALVQFHHAGLPMQAERIVAKRAIGAI